MSFRTSSRVSATATQPGRSGTCAPKLVSPCSITTAYFIVVILFQTCLFENTVQRPRRDIDVRFASNCHRSAFYLMLELTVTAFRSCQIPAIALKQLDEVANFHARMIEGYSRNWKPHNGGVDAGHACDQTR